MPRFVAIFLTFLGLTALSGCFGTAEPIWATDAEVSRAVYVDDGPPKLTLYTVINNATGSGAHTALLVNASQRAIFDPAGSWYHPQLPERNDVHYGMSDPIVDFYVDYHTRITYRTVIQEIEVPPEVAEAALREIQAYGAVRRGHCADATSEILRKLPGFEGLPRTYFPRQLSRAFGALPGVTTTIARDNDPDDNSGVIEAPPALYVSQGRS